METVFQNHSVQIHKDCYQGVKAKQHLVAADAMSAAM
jgi:hypothetical protein